MAKGFSVFVDVGARLSPTLGRVAKQVESTFARLTKSAKVFSAESKIGRGVNLPAFGIGMGAAYGATRALQPFLAFESALAMTGNTIEMHGAKLDALGQKVQRLGSAYGMTGTQALAGFQDFAAAGLSAQTAIGALEPTLKLAKASGIEVSEASQVGIASIQNLGVAVRDLGSAFDVMAKAGKLGSFELNDLSKAMPGAASRARTLGMSGLDGVRRISAMLEVARKNSRDADEAGNNLLNFMDNIVGAEAEKRFGEAGINIKRVFATAKSQGKDFMRSLVDEMARVTNNGAGGVDGLALSQLFGDRQARQAAMALIQNRKEMDSIYAKTGRAGGTLNSDFGNVAATSRFGLDRFAAGLDRIGVSLGRVFGPMLGAAAMRLATLSEQFAAWADRHPTIIKGIGLIGGGMIAIRTASAAASLALGGFVSQAISIGSAVASIIPRLLPLRLVMVGARYGIAAALAVSAPFAAAGAAIGLAIAFVIAKWDGIKAFFSGFASAVSSAISPEAREGFATFGRVVMAVLSPLTGLLSTVAGWLAKIFAPADVERWRSWGVSVGSVVGTVADALGRLIGVAARAWSAIGRLVGLNVGAPSGPAPLAGKRAFGGSVGAGKSYLVGEHGPEVVTPSRSGWVHPARRSAAMTAGGGGFTHNGDINVYAANDPQATASAVRRELARMARGNAALLSD